MADVLLSIQDLCVGYKTPDGVIRAVEDVSFDLHRGEIIGLVGESGSGKSTLVLGMMRLLPPPGVLLRGSAELEGTDLVRAPADSLRALRWNQMALVPQSALNALNPVLTVIEHVHDTLAAHGDVSRAQARERGAVALEMMGLDAVHLDSYPHQLSGGMRQRVALALALLMDPPLIVMDEPTTALDVVVEREILSRMLELQTERGFSVLFITHDVSLLMQVAHSIGVLYGGRLVELGPVEQFHAGGRHPYTQGLLRAIPPAVDEDREPGTIPGSPPSVASPPPGCRFHPRCPLADALCERERPPRVELGHGHFATCHRLAEGEGTA